MRARATLTLLAFFAALAAGGPASSLAGSGPLDRAPTLAGEIDPSPYVASSPASVQLGAARAASARPGPWKLPPPALAPAVSAILLASSVARAAPAAHAPIAPPSAPRSCRGPPRA